MAASTGIVSCQMKFDGLLAEYYSAASKINLLGKGNVDLGTISTLITDTEFANADEIPSGLTDNQVLDVYEKICKDLRTEFFKQTEGLDTLNKELKTIINP